MTKTLNIVLTVLRSSQNQNVAAPTLQISYVLTAKIVCVFNAVISLTKENHAKAKRNSSKKTGLSLMSLLRLIEPSSGRVPLAAFPSKRQPAATL